MSEYSLRIWGHGSWVKLAACLLALSGSAPASAQPTSVFIEDLTWPELQARIASGTKIAILPTGGTEASGPALALGKHNFVVRTAAEKIANALGNALVAPTIPIVPEGVATDPSGNLRFPGTLALENAVFAGVLRDEATTLARAGFTLICLIGDHGESQAIQQSVAATLTKSLAPEGVRVVHVDAYYDTARDDRIAVAAGLPRAALGDHAGVSDTAALLAARPESVRPVSGDNQANQRLGATGQPQLATEKIGEKILGARVNAAVAEITKIEAEVRNH